MLPVLQTLTRPETIRRWFWVVVTAILGGALAQRIAGLYFILIEWLFGAPFYAGVNAPTIFAAVIALLSVAWAVAWFRPSLRQFQNTFRYPSGLIAVGLGFAGFALTSNPAPVTKQEHLAYWAPLAFAVSIAGVVSAASGRRQIDATLGAGPSISPANGSVANMTPAQFDAWLERQDAISNPADDLFGSSEKAMRVTAALREARDGSRDGTRRKTIAVVGRLGVGKTSLVRLAERSLGSDTRLLFAHTSGWGFESSAKAQEAILDEAVERLTLEVDCNELRRLPAHYRDAVNESDGWLKPFFVWAFGEMAPTAQLERFSPVLKALDAHLVVVVEDLDREGSSFDTSQVIAMLHYLRSVERVSFILAMGEPVPVELFKVADEVVFIEPLLPKEALSIVDRVRIRILQNSGFVDPEELRSRPWGNAQKSYRLLALSEEQAASSAAIFMMEAGPIHNWPGDLGRILGSPRTLKGTLRDFRAKWDALWGEVDPDELLILTALRHVTPDVYQFALEHAVDFKHVSDLSGDDRDDHAKQAQTLLEKLQHRWQQAASRTPRERDAAAALLAELFPGFAEVAQHRMLGHTRRIQSVRGKRGERYLRIIHGGLVAPSDGSERTALATLRDLRQPDRETRDRALEALNSDHALAEICHALEADLQCLSQEIRLLVLSRILDEMRQKHGKQAWLMSEEIEPFRDWIPLAGDIELAGNWYVGELEKSLPEYPSLAASLIHFSADKPALATLGDMLRSVVANRWKNLSAEVFGETFVGARSHALLYIVFPLIPRDMIPPAELSWLPEKILGGMEKRPDSMLAEAVYCFQSKLESPPTYFNESAVAAFFGASESHFYEVLANSIAAEQVPQTFWGPVRDAARDKLGRLVKKCG